MRPAFRQFENGKQFAYLSTDRIRIQSGFYLGTFGEADAELLPYGKFPAWSPDGSEIACSEPHPYGTGLRQLVEEAGAEARFPVLSPDGSAVVYTQKINGQLQILNVDVNSGVRTQLTHLGWNADAGLV